jgi:hypothetical protein
MLNRAVMIVFLRSGASAALDTSTETRATVNADKMAKARRALVGPVVS